MIFHELHFQKQLTTKLLISNQVFMGKCWRCINLLSTNTYSISLKVTWGLFPSPCPWRAVEADSNLERSKFILSAVLPSNPSVINLLINPKGQLLRTRLVFFFFPALPSRTPLITSGCAWRFGNSRAPPNLLLVVWGKERELDTVSLLPKSNRR